VNNVIVYISNNNLNKSNNNKPLHFMQMSYENNLNNKSKDSANTTQVPNNINNLNLYIFFFYLNP
jgi:hypothetical protein